MNDFVRMTNYSQENEFIFNNGCVRIYLTREPPTIREFKHLLKNHSTSQICYIPTYINHDWGAMIRVYIFERFCFHKMSFI